MIEFRVFKEVEASEVRQQIVDMALQVGFEVVEDLLLSRREEMSNGDLLALEEEHIRKESESRSEEVVPVKTLMTKVMASGFKLALKTNFFSS